MRVGLHVNERDPEKVKTRDAQLRAMQAEKAGKPAEAKLIAFRVPGIEAGLVAGGGVPAAGDAFPQARVQRREREGLFDDVAGRGFMILARGDDPLAKLNAEDRAFWQALGGKVVRLDADDGVADIGGHYGKVMDAYGCDIIVKRPDYYIFGAARTASDLPALLADLRAQLGAG
jgi:hypothetical protein